MNCVRTIRKSFLISKFIFVVFKLSLPFLCSVQNEQGYKVPYLD